MPRNISAQKTMQKIIDTSLKLFDEYGFENIKMQDIVNKLAKQHLSKGAIYHYFNSKDDISEAILSRYNERLKESLKIGYTLSNGRDKVKAIVLKHLEYIRKHKSHKHSFLSSPKAIAYHLAHNDICHVLESIIQEGNADGSLRVAYPKAASEMLFWVVYIWLDTIFYPLSQNEYTAKVRHCSMMCESVGLGIFDWEVSDILLEMWKETIH